MRAQDSWQALSVTAKQQSQRPRQQKALFRREAGKGLDGFEDASHESDQYDSIFLRSFIIRRRALRLAASILRFRRTLGFS